MPKTLDNLVTETIKRHADEAWNRLDAERNELRAAIRKHLGEDIELMLDGSAFEGKNARLVFTVRGKRCVLCLDYDSHHQRHLCLEYNRANYYPNLIQCYVSAHERLLDKLAEATEL